MFVEKFAAIPEIAKLGPLFKSSTPAELTGKMNNLPQNSLTLYTSTDLELLLHSAIKRSISYLSLEPLLFLNNIVRARIWVNIKMFFFLW